MQEHFDAGRFAEALVLADDLTTDHDPCTGPAVSPYGVANYAIVLAEAGRLGQARTQFLRALELFEAHHALDRQRHTCTPAAVLLLTSFARLERQAGHESDAQSYDTWASGCADDASMVVDAPDGSAATLAGPPALPPGAGCACRLPAPPGEQPTTGDTWAWASFGALACLAARRGAQQQFWTPLSENAYPSEALLRHVMRRWARHAISTRPYCLQQRSNVLLPRLEPVPSWLGVAAALVTGESAMRARAQDVRRVRGRGRALSRVGVHERR